MLFGLAEEDRQVIYRLFAIRYRLWDGEELASEDQSLWETARANFPACPIFQRLELSPDDRTAHEHAKVECPRAIEELFASADEVHLGIPEDGFQTFSAVFRLDRKSQETPQKVPWWRRILS
jgi:hypothetical protein